MASRSGFTASSRSCELPACAPQDTHRGTGCCKWGHARLVRGQGDHGGAARGICAAPITQADSAALIRGPQPSLRTPRVLLTEMGQKAWGTGRGLGSDSAEQQHTLAWRKGDCQDGCSPTAPLHLPRLSCAAVPARRCPAHPARPRQPPVQPRQCWS